MTNKFEIRPASPPGPAGAVSDEAMDRFVSGVEPMTTVTVQIPDRLKHAFKELAARERTTVKALIITAMENLLTSRKQ